MEEEPNLLYEGFLSGFELDVGEEDAEEDEDEDEGDQEEEDEEEDEDEDEDDEDTEEEAEDKEEEDMNDWWDTRSGVDDEVGGGAHAGGVTGEGVDQPILSVHRFLQLQFLHIICKNKITKKAADELLNFFLNAKENLDTFPRTLDTIVNRYSKTMSFEKIKVKEIQIPEEVRPLFPSQEKLLLVLVPFFA